MVGVRHGSQGLFVLRVKPSVGQELRKVTKPGTTCRGAHIEESSQETQHSFMATEK